MIVQLCGRISNRPIDEVWEEFNDAEVLIRLRKPDTIVINPLKLCDHLTMAFAKQGCDPDYDHYMAICLASIPHVDKLVTLKDAHLSAGAREEMKESFKLGKDLESLEDFLN